MNLLATGGTHYLTPMLAFRLATLCSVVLVGGCISGGPVRSLVPAARNPAVVERNVDGTVTLRSVKTHVVSVLPLNKRFSGDVYALPSLHVIVTNGGDKNITLKPADVSARAGDQDVAVPTPLALQDRLDREQAAVGGSRTSFPVMRDASQPGELPHGYHGERGPPGPNRPEPFGALDYKVPKRFVEEALEPQMIRPGESGGGRILLKAEDILSGLPLKVVVTVAGEKHEFLFEVRY